MWLLILISISVSILILIVFFAFLYTIRTTRAFGWSIEYQWLVRGWLLKFRLCCNVYMNINHHVWMKGKDMYRNVFPNDSYAHLKWMVLALLRSGLKWNLLYNFTSFRWGCTGALKYERWGSLLRTCLHSHLDRTSELRFKCMESVASINWFMNFPRNTWEI